MKVVILGGYGVFGGRLARLLLGDGLKVVVAGRSLAKAEAFTAEHGGEALRLDLSDEAALRDVLEPGDVLVDAAGPFQSYADYRAARVAVACGCHVLDLSDDAEFTTGISELDAVATEAGVTVLSGVSSVPALSSAVVEKLRSGLEEVTLIDAAILPGNRAPRGRSVMAAILSQVGRPMKVWRGGAWRKQLAWAGNQPKTLPKGLRRASSPIGAPDLALFPDAFSARSVLFRAGLELPVMHHSLRVLGWLHRKGLLPRLDRLTTPLLWGAEMLKPFGSDQGGMVVRVAGRPADGSAQTRGWRLHMGQGQGPFVPAVPALLMIRRLIEGDVAAGARPAIAEFTLSEAEDALAELGGSFDAEVEPATPLFEQALGQTIWRTMPASWRAAHDVWDLHELSGMARVTRGKGAAATLIAKLFRFPPERAETPVHVTMERVGETEVWTRDFDGQKFRSVLSPAGDGVVRERFGPFAFQMSLPVDQGAMGMPVTHGWFLGVPLPKALLPRSETREFDEDGVFQFDVRLSAPLVGLIVHYRGWLEPSVYSAASAVSDGGVEGSLPFG